MLDNLNVKTIVRYKNRKLYDKTKGISGYVTLNDISNYIKNGENIQVIDDITENDITKSVLVSALSKTLLNNQNVDLDSLVNLIQNN